MISRVLRFVERQRVPCSILLLNTFLVPLDTSPERLIEVHDRLSEESRHKLEQERNFAYQCASRPIKIKTASRMGSLSNITMQVSKKGNFDVLIMRREDILHIEKMTRLLEKNKGTTLMIKHQYIYPGEIFLIFLNDFFKSRNEEGALQKIYAHEA